MEACIISYLIIMGNKKIKVLVITGNPFSKILNNGKTHEAIFSAFKKDELCQLFCRPVSKEHTDFDYCGSYYSVNELDIVKKLMLRSNKCGQPVENDNLEYNTKHEIYNKIKSNRKRNLGIFRDMLWSTNLWKTKELTRWCNEQNPNLVFIDGGGDKYLYSIAMFVAKSLKIPMVAFFTDDYLIYPIYKSYFAKLQQIRMKSFLKKTIDYASISYAIGEIMAKEYSDYFHKPFLHIMNAVEVLPYIAPSIVNKKPIISYFGGLHLDRWKMIVRLSTIINKGATIHVYSFANLSEDILCAFNKSNIIHHNGLRGSKLHDAMLNSDILLHVESDHPIQRRFTKLAISTKIPEYLISGRLIMGFGPPEVASMRLLSDNNMGFVVSSDESDVDVKNRLKEILPNYEYLNEVAKRGYDYAANNFNKSNLSLEFKNRLISIL